MAPFDISYVFTFIPKLLSTLNTTLLIVVFSLLTGAVIGTIAALPRLYHVAVLQRISQVYVSFFRGTPILIQLLLLYYGFPEALKPLGIDLSKTPVLYFVIFAYGLHAGAYFCEMIRAAVSAVDRGQVEAAYSIGMKGHQAIIRIVLPQAFGIALPVLANLVLATLKDTSLAFTLGVMEMTGKAETLSLASQHFFETYLALAIVYFLISIILQKLFDVIERRFLKHEQRIAAETILRRSRHAAVIPVPVGAGKGGNLS